METFEYFWSIYPRRNGKKLGKAKAERMFMKMKPEEIDDVFVALANYNKSKQVHDGFACDAPRFLRKDYYMDWLDGAGEVRTNNKQAVKF